MATPNLNTEIVKLRRRLGDLYDANGNKIVVSTTPGTGEIYAGDATLVSTWNADELLDCYNDAIRSYLEYLIGFIDPIHWGDYIPGYIKFVQVTATTLTVGSGLTYDFIDASNPGSSLKKILYPISIMGANDTVRAENQIGVRVAPDVIFERKYNVGNTQLFYTWAEGGIVMMNLNGTSSKKVDIAYMAQHDDLTYNGSTDLAGLSSSGLKRVLIIAEIYAQRYRSQDVRDLPDAALKDAMQSDITQINDSLRKGR